MPRVTIPGIGDVQFPDNMSRDEIMSRATAMQQQASQPEYSAKDLPASELLKGGFSRGIEGLKGTALDLIPALAGSVFGQKDYAREQLKEYAERMAAAEELSPTAYKSYKDVQGLGDILPFAAETIGELTPDALSFIGGAGLGTQVGKQIAKRGAISALEKALPEHIAKRATTDAAAAALEKRVMESAVAKGADIGSKVGLFGSSMGVNVPDVFQSIYETTGNLEPGIALAIGPLVGMLDTYLPSKILQQLGPAGKARLAASLLDKSEVVPPTWKKAFIGNVLQTTAGEGATEGLQEVLTIAGEQIAGDKKGFFSPQNIDRIITSAIKGAVGGTTLGAPGAAVEAKREKEAAQAEIGRRADIAAKAEQDRLAAEQAAFAQRQQETGDLFGEPVPAGPGMPSRTVAEKELAASPVLREIKDLQDRLNSAQTDTERAGVIADIKRLEDSLPAQSYEQQLVLNFAQNVLGYDPSVSGSGGTAENAPINVTPEGVATTPEQQAALEEARFQQAATPQEVKGYQQDMFQRELDLAQAQEQLTGRPATPYETLAAIPQTTPEFSSVLSADVLKGTGLKPQSGFYKQLVDKDVSNPDDQAAVRSILAQVRSNPSLSDSTKKAIEGVAMQAFGALAEQTNMVGPRGGIRNEVDYGRVQPRPVSGTSGESVSVPEQLGAVPTEGVGTPERGGLAPAGRPARRAGVREEVQQDTLNAPETTTQTAEPSVQAPAAETTAKQTFARTPKALKLLQAHVDQLKEDYKLAADPETKKAIKAEADATQKEIDEGRYRVTQNGLSKEFTGDVAALAKQLRNALDRMGLQKIGINLERALTNAKGEAVEGKYANKLIEVALNANNPAYTLGHEALHAMKEMGFFSPNDWNILTRHAPSWMKKYDIANRYSGLSQEEQIEEAIAEAFASYQQQEPRVASIFQKVLDTLQKLGNFISGLGFRSTSDIFGEAASGELAKARADVIDAFDSFLSTNVDKEPKYQVAAARGVFNRVDDLIRKSSVGSENQKAAISNGIQRSGSTVKSAILAMLPMHALGEVADSVFPGYGTKFNEIINRRSGYQDKLNNGIDPAMEELKNAIKTRPDQRDAFNDVVNESTIYEVDPSDEKNRSKYVGQFDRNGNSKEAEFDRLRKQYMKLSPVWKQAYTTMRDAYKQMYKEITDAIEARIDETNLASETKSSLKADIMKKLTERGMIEPYFALGREGDKWLSYDYTDKNGQTQRAHEAFKSNYERDTRRAELMRMGVKEENLQSYSKLSEVNYRNAPSGSFVNSVLQIMEVNNVPADAIDETMRLFLTTLPETAFAQSFQRRGNKAGYMKDTIGVFERKMRNMAHQVANMRYNPQISAVVNDMATYADNVGAGKVQKKDAKGNLLTNDKGEPIFEPARDNATEKAYAEEFEKHKGYVLNPTKNDVGSILTSAAFTYTLGFNLSSALVNMANIPMIVAPYLKGKYADSAVARALGDAAKDFAGSGTKTKMAVLGGEGRQTEMDVMPSITNYAPDSEMGKKYATLIRIGKEQGQFNRSQLYEIINGDTRTGLMTKFNALSGWMFHHGERMNREVTMMATYNLEMDKLKKQGITGVEAEEQAAKTALYTNELTNGGISAAAAPRFAQSAFGKMIFMYKRYGVSMYYMMFKTFKEARYGATPEERRAAWRQLGGIAGMSALMAGAQGIPLYGALSMLYALFCDDDDEDFDTVTRKYLGEFLYKGPIEYMTNLSIASRITLNDLIIRDTKGGSNAGTFSQQLFQAVGGPVVGVADRIQRGYSKMNEGHFWRGMEDVLPSAAGNALKGVRYFTEGTTTLRGDPITGDVSAYNSVAQALGFAPADYTRQLEINATEKGIDKTLSEKSTKLKQKYYIAKRNGDTDGMANAKEKMLEIGAKHPELGINGATINDILKRSMTAQERATKEMLHGVRYNKKRLAEVKASLAEYED